MDQLLPKGARRGEVVASYACAPGKNALALQATFDKVPEGVGFWFLIEQLVGADWCVIGGADVTNLASAAPKSPILGSDGSPLPGALVLEWNFYEQVVADPKGWSTSRGYQIDGKEYAQLAFESQVRVTIDTYAADRNGEKIGDAEVDYAIDLLVDDKPLPTWAAPNIGRG